MSKILETAIERAKKNLSEHEQDLIGRWINDMIDQDQSDAQLSPEQIEELHRRVHVDVEVPLSPEDARQFFSKFA